MEIHGYTKPKIVGKVIFHYFNMVLLLYTSFWHYHITGDILKYLGIWEYKCIYIYMCMNVNKYIYTHTHTVCIYLYAQRLGFAQALQRRGFPFPNKF